MDGVAHFVVEHDIADLLSQFLGSGLHLPQLLAIELKGNPSDLRFEGGKASLTGRPASRQTLPISAAARVPIMVCLKGQPISPLHNGS